MANPTQTQFADPFAGESPFASLLTLQLPASDDVYDQIMGGIEPELVSTGIPSLTTKYKNETPQQATARAARYAKAFAEYDKQFQDYVTALDAKVHTYQRDALASAEKRDRTQDEQAMAGLEGQISSI